MKAENVRRDKIQSEAEGGLAGRDLDATAFSDMTDRENLKYVILALSVAPSRRPKDLIHVQFSADHPLFRSFRYIY